MTDKPTFVSHDMMTSDESHVQWMTDIKQRFRQNQLKATVRVNTAMLRFYWNVGRDLVAPRAKERWETSVVKQFALDVRQAFPNETGFSYTNVKYMKHWHLFYSEKVTKGQRVVDQSEMPEIFGRVSWGQHFDIISRCETLEEALSYVQQAVDRGWSRMILNANIDKTAVSIPKCGGLQLRKHFARSTEPIDERNTERPQTFRFPFE